MKKFNEWLETRDLEMYEEMKLSDRARNAAKIAAILAGSSGIFAGLGSMAPRIADTTAQAQDKAGNLIGIKNYGDITRAKENRRAQWADKVGGDAALGGIFGAGVGASFLADKRVRDALLKRRRS
jgi:hypothetical protein